LQRDRARVRRISWPVLFMKAYGLLSARQPVLRQVYMRFPTPYLYEHPYSIARMTVSRRIGNQDWVMFARVYSPEMYSLLALQEQIDNFKHAPIETIDRFRYQLAFSRFPRWARRLAWWCSLNISGRARIDRFGTFGMTTVSGHGALSIHPPTIQSSMLTFGPVDEAGNVRVTIVYDHRLVDGGIIAGFMEELESILNHEVLNELRDISSATPENPGRRSVQTDAAWPLRSGAASRD